MNFWRDLTIGRKIGAVVAGFLLISTAISALGLIKMGAMNDKAAEIRDNWLPSVSTLGDLRAAVLRLGRAQGDAVIAAALHEDEESAAAGIDQRLEAVQQAYDAYKPMITAGTPDAELMAKFARIWPDLTADAIHIRDLARRDDAPGAAQANRKAYQLRLEAQTVLQQAANFNRDAGKAAAEAAAEAYREARAGMIGALVFSLAAGAGLGLSLIRGLVAPLGRATSALQALARGDRSAAAASDDGRRDEVGDLVRALAVFRAKLDENHRLAEDAASQKTQAEAERRAQAQKLADEFDRNVNGIVEQVARAASEFQGAARIMSDSAIETATQAKTVMEESEHSSSNVNSVASATEELSYSVKEISDQVVQSKQVASDSAAQAEKTDSQMRELAQAAEKIGGIVSLISEIAGQTNMLALNATIEAARAGEAGRGFAVVAQEVKSLAEQTARATAEISGQISDIQNTAQRAAQNISGIVRTTEESNVITQGIVASVSQQGEATAEIARNVQQASKRAQSVAENIGGVLQSAQNASAASAQMAASAETLASQSARLRREVDAFLSAVRAA